MTHKHLLSILFLFSNLFIHAQTTINGSFMHGGKNRTYSFYVPASYNPANEAPMVIGLHGLSSSGADFAQYRDFRPIADTANFIMVHPDGSTMLGVRFWNYGNILGSTVDDVGFLEALIDTIAAQYNINSKRIYCVGMSNGSFMSYLMACESNRFAAVAGVTGSMSTDMYNSCNPMRPTPTMHIHGTDDNTNPYEGTSSMVGIEQMSRFWVNQNGCDTTPSVNPVPNTNTSDGAMAIRYVYSGGVDNHTVELFKVVGGEHTWPGSPMPGSSDVTCMDFDACREIWRFFSQYEKSEMGLNENYTDVELNVWPNPTSNIAYIESKKYIVTHVTIFDIRGREVERIAKENIQYIDLTQLKNGIYLAKISGTGFDVSKKLIITR